MGNRLIFIILIKISFLLHIYPQDVSNTKSIDKEQSHVNINCFVYHRFGDKRYPSTNVSEEYFESHLRYLKDNDYLVLTLGEAIQLLHSEKKTEAKLVVITIDDGYKSFITSGMPLLRKYGFKATMFINTNQVGYPDFLSWEEILSLTQEGIEIGNHSHSHDYFVDFQSDQLIEKFNADLRLSQKIFEDKLGYKPELYSYPFGEYSNAMKTELAKFGFVGAVGQNSGVISLLSDHANAGAGYIVPTLSSKGGSGGPLLERDLQHPGHYHAASRSFLESILRLWSARLTARRRH